MKKVLLLLAFSTAVVVAAQAQSSHFDPYISGGVSLSQGVGSQGVELGIYNSKTWVALTYAHSQGSHWAGLRTYYKLNSQKFPSLVDTYVSVGGNLALQGDHALTLEPGLAVVFNASNRVAPQAFVSFPIPEQLNAVSASFGVGLNIWLY